MDISESGRQIGEKLFALLDTEQQKDLLQYILNRENLSDFPDIFLCTVSKCHGFQNHHDGVFLPGGKNGVCQRSGDRINS